MPPPPPSHTPQGGNSPIVVCDDCDLDDAVKGAHEALFFNMVRVL